MDDEPQRTAESLAQELLGRRFADLDGEEQNVLRRVASGRLVGDDADEEAMRRATLGDHVADKVAAVGGSWGFIIGFMLVLFAWMLINSHVLEDFSLPPFDAYPYIFLNLMLSTLAAIQAPVIMMSQNRQSRKDRVTAQHDYEVNLRTQLEIILLQRRIEALVEAVHAQREHPS